MERGIKNEATQLLERYCEAYKNRDLVMILSMFTKDCTLWGTAIDDHRVGLKALEAQHQRDWSQADRNEIQIVDFMKTPHDAPYAAAFCKSIITLEGKEHVFERLRGSIGITKEEGIWKIAHMHASLPDFRV